VSLPDTETQSAESHARQELNLPKSADFSRKSAPTVPPAVPKSKPYPDLAEILAAWPSLSDPLKAAVLAVIRSAQQSPRHPAGSVLNSADNFATAVGRRRDEQTTKPTTEEEGHANHN
jgi:hypothetical protein